MYIYVYIYIYIHKSIHIYTYWGGEGVHLLGDVLRTLPRRPLEHPQQLLRSRHRRLVWLTLAFPPWIGVQGLGIRLMGAKLGGGQLLRAKRFYMKRVLI